ncbi:C4-dicarboxylate transport sensor protein DctB [Tsuneonella dongtanensis]|uniref:histidine kinase n=1 Tax=Tsuneonella dongtanensis TaxID=692370 RepID=A0A1B2AEI8_9SPHN|nr:XrtA/PEP-CTERM system histidine kinase PrsK [Tsuneonella dongtanensis]ANY20564.1 C4-dicarboxylate transport sensor protein DctB [Tsuneonella dongtanensis]
MGAASFWQFAGFFLSLGGAVACAVVAVMLLTRNGNPRREHASVIVALVASAAWCVTIAAWGPGTLPASLVESGRNLAWLFVLYRLFGNDGRDHSLAPIRPLVFVLALVECLQPAVAILQFRFADVKAIAELAFSVGALFRALVSVGALVLLHNLYAGASGLSRQMLRWSAAALAGLWAFQLNLYAVAWLVGYMPVELAALRGLVIAGVALLFAIGANARAAELKILPSRTVAFQSLSLLVIGAYLIAMTLLAESMAVFGGEFSRFTQVGFLFAAATVALLWLPSKRMRGWLRVKAFKHLFQHRYDYRAEWLRFTGTIGRAGPEAPALSIRAAQALADITDSQGAALLLPAEGGEMVLAGHWQWPELSTSSSSCDAELAALLERTGKIVELDDVRDSDDAEIDPAVVPPWLIDDRKAWAIVPLIHFERLVGVAVLARPPLARRLDWEDFDLLKVVGRQLASYLAEQAGHEALIEASRFEEFNRRIAFVMHDIKNLASQLSLLARNAERHADNPAFRADMLVTLTKSAEKLNALLARLGRYGAAGGTGRVPVDLALVARRIALRYSGARRVELTRCDPCVVKADAEALEQALVHIVQNAIDASDPDMPVFIDVSCDGLQGRIEIIDSGSGMSPQFVRDKLFKPFVSSKEGGFGIGAFEARELIRAMGGRLDVDSREGLGTRFATVLPMTTAVGPKADINLQQEVA